MTDVGAASHSAQEILSLFRAGGALHEVSPERARSHEYKAALRAYDDALRETTLYINEVRKRPAAYNVSTEEKLSRLWSDASIAMSTFDNTLATACFIKGQGWLDPAIWHNPQYKEYRVSLDDMRHALTRFHDRYEEGGKIPRWFAVAGVSFAAATFLSLLFLLVGPDLSDQKRIIFNVWIAFCVACSAAFLGGDAVAKGTLKLPFMKDAPIQFSAYGGIAIFIVVFIILRMANPSPLYAQCDQASGYPLGDWNVSATQDAGSGLDAVRVAPKWQFTSLLGGIMFTDQQPEPVAFRILDTKKIERNESVRLESDPTKDGYRSFGSGTVSSDGCRISGSWYDTHGRRGEFTSIWNR